MIFLFRHGDRTSRGSSGLQEPDLSPTGQNQADQLRLWVERGTLPRPGALWVSPRIRAQKTFAPLAQNLGLELQIQTDLDERQSSESALVFRDRMIRGLEAAASLSGRLRSRNEGALFCCSHYDWLEEALTWIPADEDLPMQGQPLWSPGSFVGFEIENEIWKVQQKGQLQAW